MSSLYPRWKLQSITGETLYVDGYLFAELNDAATDVPRVPM